jgi:NitT/TauT family transport system substrate-binding protein
MNKRSFTSHLCAASAIVLAASLAQAAAQTPRANGETLVIQNYASTTGNMHAIIANEKGFCEKYNFKCEIRAINSTSLGLQALVGKTIDIAQWRRGSRWRSGGCGRRGRHRRYQPAREHIVDQRAQ